MPASNIFFAIWIAIEFLPSSRPFSKAVSIEFLTSRYAFKLSSSVSKLIYRSSIRFIYISF